MDELDLTQLLGDYIDEAEGLLVRMEQLIMEVERERVSGTVKTDTLNELFRCAHTLKGSSGLVGLGAIEELAHEMESIFDALRSGEVTLSQETLDLLLQCIDTIELLLLQVKNGEELDEALAREVSERLRGIFCHPLGESEAQPCIELPQRIKAVLTEGEEATLAKCVREGIGIYEVSVPAMVRNVESVVETCKQVLAKVGEIISVIHTPPVIGGHDITCSFLLASSLSEDEIVKAVEGINADVKCLFKPSVTQLKPVEESVVLATDQTKAGELAVIPPLHVRRETVMGTMRVDVHKLDKLLSLVGELIVIRSRYSTIEKLLKEVLKGDKVLEELERTNRFFCRRLDELRESVFEARMVPLNVVFMRAPRLVRDLAKETGKLVRLTIDGGDIEADRSVVEAIAEPLMHLLRNAIDHGIELPEERERVGKERVGSVWLKAWREGGKIVVEVGDDGRGIDLAKVAKRAAELGLAHNIEGLSHTELLELICQPGFSTSAHVTRVSGRGIGLDVVKSLIEKIGGALEMETEEGVGTVFRMRLPVTVSILSVFLTKVGKAICAIPMEMVRMVMKMRKECVRQVSGVKAYQFDDGRLLPMIRLSDLFVGVNDEQEQKEFLMLIEAHGISACLVTNEPLGFHDVVIKPLPEPLNRIEVLMGVAELGDGSLATVIDVHRLLATSFKHVPSSMRREVGIKRYEPTHEALIHLLVFELSGKFFAAPVEQVAEVISQCELLRLPNMPYPIEGMIEWHGGQIPVVDLRRLLGFERKPFDAKEKLIVANADGKHFAFAVDRLVDVVAVELKHVHQLVNMKGITGITKCSIAGKKLECILIDLSYWASLINITSDTKNDA
ncbi:MAG: hypothetical protein RUDDFDWM_000273 [Candidatus Fervidibacterota bacterium]